MEIKKIVVSVACLLMGIFSLSSCQNDIWDEVARKAGDEKVYLSMNLPATDDIVVSRAEASDLEKRIYTVHVLGFDNDGICFYNEKVYDGYASKTPYQTSQVLGIMKRTGIGYDNCTIWVIANAGVWVGVSGSYNFDEVKTLSDLQETYGYRLLQGSQLAQRDCLAMTGVATDVDMTQPTSVDAPITVNMERVMARVTFTIDVTNDNLEFYFNDWTVESLPRYTYVMPQDHDFAGDKETPPASYGFYYPSNEAETNLVTYPVSEWLSSMEPTTFGFYTYENRRGNRLDSPDPANLQGEAGDYAEEIRNLTDNANSPKFKTLYAPKNASFITLSGLIREKDTQNVTSFAYKIALGANNTDDYNLLRNHNYVYNIHINGVHYDDITVDAFDSRVHKAYALQISAPYCESMDAHYDKRYLDILASAGTIDLQLYPTQQDAEAGTNPLGDNAWIVLSDMDTYNIDIDPSESSAKTLTYDDVSNQTLYVYVDENTTTQSRSAVLKVIHTPESGSSEIVTQPVVRYYTYTQAGLIEVNGIYAESYEEYGMNLNPYGEEQPVTGLQWGWKGVTDFAPRYDWSDDTYDVTSTSDGYDNSSKIFLYETNHPSQVAFDGVDVNSLYNNYATRYCYNKNKRTKDGVVESVEWYLPAVDELIPLTGNISDMREKSSGYWSSSVPTYIETSTNPGDPNGSTFERLIYWAWRFIIWLVGAERTYDDPNWTWYYGNVAKAAADGDELMDSAGDYGGASALVYNPRTYTKHVRCVRRLSNNP